MWTGAADSTLNCRGSVVALDTIAGARDDVSFLRLCVAIFGKFLLRGSQHCDEWCIIG